MTHPLPAHGCPLSSPARERPSRAPRVLLVLAASAGLLAAVSAAVAQDEAAERARQAEQVGGRPAAQPQEAQPSDEMAPPVRMTNDRPAPQPTPPPPPPGREPDPVFRLAFTDAIELNTLVNYVAEQLGVQIIITDGGLFGQKVFISGPITVPRGEMLRFLDTLLVQKNYTITRGIGGIYTVQPVGDVTAAAPGLDPFSPTKVIPTPGLRPSSLAPAIAVVVGGAQVAGGVPGQQFPGRSPNVNLAYLDDLGVILITAAPRTTQLIEEVVQVVLAEQARIGYQRFELRYVAAAFARDRVLDLLGLAQQRPIRPQVQQPGQPPQPMAVGPTTTGLLGNLEDRLTVDPQSNALFFRGRSDEGQQLSQLLAIVDVPNTLVSRWYSVGRASQAIAAEGQRQGLGSVIVEQGGVGDASAALARGNFPQMQQFGAPARTEQVGPGFVIFSDIGGFVYRGTPFQHEQVDRLIAQLGDLASAEVVVVEFYKLRHSKAVDVAGLINQLLDQQIPTGSSPLLGRDLGRGAGRQQRVQGTIPPPAPGGEGAPDAAGAAPGAGGGDVAAIRATEDTFVIADEGNNQVVIKAPKRLQPQFARLIERLDLRRPQVYIDAKIVAVTASDDFRLSFETQILAGQFALNTNFGLGGFPAGGQITDTKTVPPLAGLTSALIRSRYVPVIINTLQRNTDARVLAVPQLLVDDNEEAEVASFEEQPFGQISRSAGVADIITQGGTAEAGTRLRVTPQISEGGYLRLQYAIEQSSFTGPPASEGLAPPSQRNEISSASVTIPSDTTIVVGGLRVSSEQNAVLKIPLLGDIPLVGHLFRDTRKTNQSTTLYVFITPTIVREPTFDTLRLLTRGPARQSGLELDLPPRLPVRAEILGRSRPSPSSPPPAPPSTVGSPESDRRAPGADRGGWVAPSVRGRGGERREPGAEETH